jgi:Ni/Co efflux regulator RcnB
MKRMLCALLLALVLTAPLAYAQDSGSAMMAGARARLERDRLDAEKEQAQGLQTAVVIVGSIIGGALVISAIVIAQKRA